ncbi:MAG: CHRD domain-containing protein [Planctomycetes bacterium]|nr:CHRD domain-containing protein [Planctomycetota bacterium]
MKQCSVVLMAGMVCLAMATSSSAQTFVFPIDASQVVMPMSTSTASGTGNVTYNPGTMMLNWNITFSGLTSAQTAAHFHGPAPFGVNAGVQVGIGVGSPALGNAPITTAQATDLLNGLWYVNIHTTNFPGGEIRGQVVPEPSTLAMMGLAAVAVLRRRRC